jgi:hypothetical protein
MGTLIYGRAPCALRQKRVFYSYMGAVHGHMLSAKNESSIHIWELCMAKFSHICFFDMGKGLSYASIFIFGNRFLYIFTI